MLVLISPPPNWVHTVISMCLLSFETMQRPSENGPGLGWGLHCSQSFLWQLSQLYLKSTSASCRGFNTTPILPHSPLLPLPPALQEDDRRPCSVIRCLSVLESSSDRLQEAVFMPDDGDHRKQKCLFVPPGLGMSTISRGQYQILPSSSPNTHSCVRSGGILHQQRDKQAKAKPHTVLG